MKKKISLTEGQLSNIIRKSVRKILNEGAVNSDTTDLWYKAIDINGADTILDAIYHYLSEDQIEDIIGWLKQDEYIVDDEEEDYL